MRIRRLFVCTRRVPRPSATSTPLLAPLAPDVSALTRLETVAGEDPRPFQRPRSGHRPSPTLLSGTCFAPAPEVPDMPLRSLRAAVEGSRPHPPPSPQIAGGATPRALVRTLHRGAAVRWLGGPSYAFQSSWEHRAGGSRRRRTPPSASGSRARRAGWGAAAVARGRAERRSEATVTSARHGRAVARVTASCSS